MSLPQLVLRKLTLFRNNYQHVERSGGLADAGGNETPPATAFELYVDKKHKPLVIDTLHVTVPEQMHTTISYDRLMQLEDATSVQGSDKYDFSFGQGVGMGAFLDSCVGARMTVETTGMPSITGRILSVEKKRVVVGSQASTEITTDPSTAPLTNEVKAPFEFGLFTIVLFILGS